ncbi:DMT family protein [Tessaracoccus sp. Z1128]
MKSTFDPTATASSNTLTFAGLLRLFRIPKWLLGLVFVFAGASIHLVALSFAPVAVVQPVGILAVPWSVLLASRIHKHALTRKMWVAVAVTVAGVVGFTVFSSLFATGEKQVEFLPMLFAFLVVCVICAVLSYLATKAAPWAKAMMWSSVGATFYGLASGFMKAAMDLVLKHGESFAGFQVVATVAMMLACYGLGVWMIQQGYASGPAEITVGTMTTVDPFVAVLFGLIVLGEGIGMGPGPALGMLVTGALAVYGVLLLSKDHPDAVEERRKLAEASENEPASAPPMS